MNNFMFHNPVQLHFGAGILDGLGRTAASFGKKALIVTSGYFSRNGETLARVRKGLEDEGIACAVFPKVEPNPRLSTVREGVRICRENNIEILVALGGGSVIDCAKAVGFCVFDDGNPWDFFTGARAAQKSLPLICVTTAAASGSEMNANCVVTNEALGQKYVTRFPCCYPKASFVDAELHKTLPAFNTACGMTDAITHVLEKYFDGTTDTPMQDRFAEGIVRTIIENEGVLVSPGDTAMRENIALASIFALNGVCDVGRGRGNFDAHTVELELSARYDVAHGAGLAVIYPAWMRHLCRKNPSKFVQFGERIFGFSGGRSPGKAAGETKGAAAGAAEGFKGIDALRQLFVRWGMPPSLKSMGVSFDDLAAMAERIVLSPKGNYLDRKEVYTVLRDCYE